MSVYNSRRVQNALGANIPKDEKKDTGRKADPKTEDIYIINYYSGEVFEATDKNGSSDPYCRLGKVKKENVFSKKWVSESRVEPKTLKPVWNQEDEFILKKTITQLVIEVWDKDTLKDDYIGRAVFDVSSVTTYGNSFSLKLYKDDDKNGAPAVGTVNFSIKKLNLSGSAW